MKKPEEILRESLRVGKKAIIGIPNFAHIRARCQIFFNGRVPVTSSLPFEWYNTPNLHFLSLLDFVEFCRRQKIIIEGTYYVNQEGRIRISPNLFALTGIFLLSGFEA